MEKRKKIATALVLVFGVAFVLSLLPIQYRVEVNDTLIFGNTEFESDHMFVAESNIFIRVIRGDGSIETYEGENVICNDALTALRPYISDTPGNAFIHIGVGTGTGGGAGSADLTTPYSTRGSGTYSIVSAYVFKVVYTFPAAFFADTTITETGLFNAATGVTMFNYHSFTGIFLSAADSLEMTHQITLSSA